MSKAHMGIKPFNFWVTREICCRLDIKSEWYPESHTVEGLQGEGVQMLFDNLKNTVFEA